MLIELRKGMTLHPCTFNVVIAPEKVMISALNNNVDLQSGLTPHISAWGSFLFCSLINNGSSGRKKNSPGVWIMNPDSSR